MQYTLSSCTVIASDPVPFHFAYIAKIALETCLGFYQRQWNILLSWKYLHILVFGTSAYDANGTQGGWGGGGAFKMDSTST